MTYAKFEVTDLEERDCSWFVLLRKDATGRYVVGDTGTQNVRTDAQACDESTNRARAVASVANDWVVEADSASNFV